MSVQYSLDEVKSIYEKHYSHIENYFKENPDAPNKDLHLEVLRLRLNDLIGDVK
jgi:hypothetical protein